MKGEVTMSYTHSFEDIRNRPVAVFGAGTLGRRIALMLASRHQSFLPSPRGHT
jgi:hypothetical protein